MNRGFTIIEFVVYAAVLAVIIGAVASLFLWTVQAHTKSRVVQQTIQQASLAMNHVMREIREAESVYTPTTTGNQLSLETTSFVSAGETTGYVDFFLCGDRICQKEQEQLPLALTPETMEVVNFTVVPISTNTSFPSVRITLELRYKNPNNRPELQAVAELTSTASVR